MGNKHSILRYRRWYAKLLCLYSKRYYERYGEGMEQTFSDILQERAAEGKGLFGCVLWMFGETFAWVIRERITVIIMQNRKIIRWMLIAASILLLPLLAMQFTDEVVWNLADFVVAWVLLFGAGLTYELVARKVRATDNSMAYQAAVGLAVATALLLVWVNLAVGLIGNEGNSANLMYCGVLAVGILGAIIARFQPDGMSRAMFATAFAQMLVAVIAQAAGLGFTFILNGFFAVLWIGSGLLFRRASVSGWEWNRRLE